MPKEDVFENMVRTGNRVAVGTEGGGADGNVEVLRNKHRKHSRRGDPEDTSVREKREHVNVGVVEFAGTSPEDADEPLPTKPRPLEETTERSS